MKNSLRAALPIIGLLACLSSASAQTTYSWSWITGDQSRDLPTPHTLSLTVPSAVSTFTISAVFDETFTYSLTSGPALIIGEGVNIHLDNFPVDDGMFKIVGLGTDGSGNTTFTIDKPHTLAGNVTGEGTAGPQFEYLLYFDNGFTSTATCDSGQSSSTAWFLDAGGNLQSVSANSGSLTCSDSPDGFNTTLTTGSFIGTGTDGQQHSVSFTIKNQTARGIWAAVSASWTVQ